MVKVIIPSAYQGSDLALNRCFVIIDPEDKLLLAYVLPVCQEKGRGGKQIEF